MIRPPVFALVSALLIAGSAVAAPATFETAVSAYRQNKVAEAEAGYRAVIADPSAKAVDKARSHRELGRVAWLVDADPARSLRELAAAEAVGEEVCLTAAVRARVMTDAGKAREAADYALARAGRCTDSAEADGLRTLAIAALTLGGAEDWSRAVSVAGEFSPDAATDLDAQRALLELALRRGDAPGALAAWRNYFWLTDLNAPPALSALETEIPALFERGLNPTASLDDQLRLVELLVRVGFADAARVFADDQALAEKAAGDPRWAKTAAYLAFITEIRSQSLRYKRIMARGGNGAPYKQAVVQAVLRLSGAKEPPAARDILLREYGIFGTVGETGGFASMHAGHVIDDDRREVSQYGRTGTMRFLVVDGVIDNGFESWLWDGWAAAGGWAEDSGEIVQLRPLYTGGPLKALALVGDTAKRQQAEARISSLAAEDARRAMSTKVVFLPSVSDRFKLRAVDQIAAQARARGGDFRKTFLEEYWRIINLQSIFIHEGRHALDKAAAPEIGKLSSEEFEYRAKLSELAFSEVPALQMSILYSALVENDTPHGAAGRRVIEGLVAWMRAHPREVEGYDPAQPAILQLAKLSDAQLAAIARGLDPWAGGAPKPAA